MHALGIKVQWQGQALIEWDHEDHKDIWTRQMCAKWVYIITEYYICKSKEICSKYGEFYVLFHAT